MTSSDIIVPLPVTMPKTLCPGDALESLSRGGGGSIFIWTRVDFVSTIEMYHASRSCIGIAPTSRPSRWRRQVSENLISWCSIFIGIITVIPFRSRKRCTHSIQCMFSWVNYLPTSILYIQPLTGVQGRMTVMMAPG